MFSYLLSFPFSGILFAFLAGAFDFSLLLSHILKADFLEFLEKLVTLFFCISVRMPLHAVYRQCSMLYGLDGLALYVI